MNTSLEGRFYTSNAVVAAHSLSLDFTPTQKVQHQHRFVRLRRFLWNVVFSRRIAGKSEMDLPP